MVQVNISEARRRFKELLDRAAAGERIVISRDGTPLAELSPPRDDEKAKIAKRFDAEKIRRWLEEQPMDPRSPEEIDAEMRSLDRY